MPGTMARGWLACPDSWRGRFFERSNFVVKTLAFLVALAAVPVAAQTITDGDTLKLGGITYRLWGIDAPEIKQDCADGWPAGRLAATRLLALAQGKTVTCEGKDRDRYGRTVAVCWAGGEDLGAIMVREGMAWAFLRYSRDYVRQEEQARAEGLGVHGHDCILAWEWRAQHRR